MTILSINNSSICNQVFPRGFFCCVVANVWDCDIAVSEFEL